MPQWFLALWVAARDIVGNVASAPAEAVGGLLNYFVLPSGAKTLTLPTTDGAAQTVGSKGSISIQTSVLSSNPAADPGYGSVVIGSFSGVRGNVAGGGNIVIGAPREEATEEEVPGALIRMEPSDMGGHIAIGVSATVDFGNASELSAQGNSVALGPNCTAPTNGCVAVGSQAKIGANGRVIEAGSTAIGAAVSIIDWSDNPAASTLATAVGTNLELLSGATSLTSTLTAFGTQLVQTNFATNGKGAIFGQSARQSLSTQVPYLLTLAMARDQGSHQAGIDIAPGTDVNDSLVLLGSSKATTPSGSNAAYNFAFGDQGKILDVGTASATIPNNCSTFILAGSGTRTLTFPAAPFDGQFLTLSLGAAHTALTLAGGAGRTIVDGTIGVTAGTVKTWIYHALTPTTGTWYRHG